MYVTSRHSIANTRERIPRPVLEVGDLWRTCVRGLMAIDTGEGQGDDYDDVRIKFELERIRFLFWGQGVYIADLDDTAYSAYKTLDEEQKRGMAMHSLGKLRGVLDHPDRLEKDYGLRQVSNTDLSPPLYSTSLRRMGSPTSPIFKEAYGRMISLATDHDCQNSIDKVAKWMIVDKRKFLDMITLIRVLIDDLHNVEEYLHRATQGHIYDGISTATDTEVLKLLQAVTLGDYEDISQAANARLKELEKQSDDPESHHQPTRHATDTTNSEELDELAVRTQAMGFSTEDSKTNADLLAASEPAPQTSVKANEAQGRLCYNCERTVMIDDRQLGRISRNQDGFPIFEYTKIDTRNQQYTPDGGIKIIDDLPDLPRLRAKGDGPFGCDFCRFLRRSILQNHSDEKRAQSRVEIQLSYAFDASSTRGPFAFQAILSPRSESYPPKLLFPVVANGDCAEWLRLEPPIRDTLDSRSIECLQNVLAHFQSLPESTNHSGDKFLPTRLLEIAPEDTTPNSQALRLVLQEDLDQEMALSRDIQYAALSYCWGSASEAATQAVTKKDTLGDRCGGIPAEDLPPAISDAIKVCRALSIRHLWVDALCIIQDSSDDWEIEAAKMAEVYGAAFLTICPIASTSCRQGFLERGPVDSVEVPFSSALLPQIKGSYKFWQAIPVLTSGQPLNPYQAQGAISYSKWNTRGWTFQEFQFSSKLLCIGSLRSYLIGSEKVITELGLEETLEGALAIPLHNQIKETFQVEHDKSKAYDMWMDIVEGYTGRQLTYPMDSLPAISGVAQTFSQGLKDEYKAGLWSGDLPRQLLWDVDGDQKPDPSRPRSSEHVQSLQSLLDFLSDRRRCPSPSWSWSSRPINIRYFSIRLYSTAKMFLQLAHSLEALTVIEGENPVGLVSYGELVITSEVKRLESRFTTKKVHKYGRLETFWDVFLDGDIDQRMDLHFDCVMSNADLDAREILLVVVGFTTSLQRTWGLIICKHPDVPGRDVWCRIGIFSHKGPHGVDGWRQFAGDAVMKTVVIV